MAADNNKPTPQNPPPGNIDPGQDSQQDNQQELKQNAIKYKAFQHTFSPKEFKHGLDNKKISKRLREGDLSSSKEVTTVTLSIPAGTDGWVEIPIHAVIESSNAWIVLDRTADVQWRCGEAARAGSCRVYGVGDTWTKVDGSSMRTRFMPEVWVFPGGRVDPDDHDPARPGDELATACRAAIREAAEDAFDAAASLVGQGAQVIQGIAEFFMLGTQFPLFRRLVSRFQVVDQVLFRVD